MALSILVAKNGSGRQPDPMQFISAHLEAQHALLGAIASGRVEKRRVLPPSVSRA